MASNKDDKITYAEFLDTFAARTHLSQDKLEDILQYSLCKKGIDQTPKEYYEHNI